MAETTYVVECEPAVVRYRVRFVREKGKILDFVVQLEFCQFEDWRPVVRFDTAHGFAHSDIFNREGQVKAHQPMEVSDYNQALTVAVQHVRDRWPELAAAFREEAS